MNVQRHAKRIQLRRLDVKQDNNQIYIKFGNIICYCYYLAKKKSKSFTFLIWVFPYTMYILIQSSSSKGDRYSLKMDMDMNGHDHRALLMFIVGSGNDQQFKRSVFQR